MPELNWVNRNQAEETVKNVPYFLLTKQSEFGTLANSQQPTANSQQPTANSQQPTANSQQPTANSQFNHSGR